MIITDSSKEFARSEIKAIIPKNYSGRQQAYAIESMLFEKRIEKRKKRKNGGSKCFLLIFSLFEKHDLAFRGISSRKKRYLQP